MGKINQRAERGPDTKIPNAIMPSPASAWTPLASGDEADFGKSRFPGYVSDWDIGARGVSQKRLLTSSQRKVLRKAHRRHSRAIKSNSFHHVAVSDGEEGEKPARPSDIVGDESDSCSDYAYARVPRMRHRRRKRATIMRIKNLDLTGNLIPAQPWLLRRRHMGKYSLYLKPPPEDMNIRRITDHRELLSSKRAIRRRRFVCDDDDEAKMSQSDNPPTSASEGFADDDDFFESSESPASDPRAHAPTDFVINVDEPGTWANPSKSRGQRREKSKSKIVSVDLTGGQGGRKKKQANGTVKEPTEKRFGYTLANSGDKGKHHAEHSAGRGLFMTGKRLRVRTQQTPPKKKRKTNGENKTLLDEMNELVLNDPSRLFECSTPLKEAKRSAGEASMKKEVEEVVDELQDKDQKKVADGELSEGEVQHCSDSSSEEVEKTITVFEMMKVDSLRNFYYLPKHAVDSSDSEHEKIEKSSGERSEPAGVSMQPSFELHSRSIGSRILAKFGFTGRLGAKETGIFEPLGFHDNTTRVGIGNRKKDRGKLSEMIEDQKVSEKGKESVNENGSKHGTTKKKKKGRKEKVKTAGSTKTKTEQSTVTTGSANSIVDKAFIDNGRRAIILDFDAVIFNSHARRVAAFKAFVAGCPEISNTCGIGSKLATRTGDVSDRECIKALLDESKIESNSGNIRKYLEKLDAAFEAGPDPEVDEPLLFKLKCNSMDLAIGVMHYGSERRMRRELKMAGLKNSFLPDSQMTVQETDAKPYLKSWRDLFCRVGVRPCQSMMLLNDHGRSRVLCSVIAANVFGARSFVRVDTNAGSGYSPVKEVKMGRENMFGATMASADSVFARGINFLSFTRKLNTVRVRRVCALYSLDCLWYAGREQFRQAPTEGDDGPLRVLVQFDHYNNTEWVDAKDVRPLENSQYLKLKEKDFPGMLDPLDVEDL